jgi:hypothetical protein
MSSALIYLSVLGANGTQRQAPVFVLYQAISCRDLKSPIGILFPGILRKGSFETHINIL